MSPLDQTQKLRLIGSPAHRLVRIHPTPSPSVARHPPKVVATGTVCSDTCPTTCPTTREDDVIDIIEMTRSTPDVVVPAGTTVIVEGERTGALYVLVDGVLEVRRRGRAVVQMSEPGTIVGELGLLLDTVASADVVAIGDCVVRRLDDAERTFSESPAFAQHLATVLAHRLWQISTYLSDVQAQYADRADTLGLMPTVLQELLGGRRPPVEPGSDREVESPY